MRKLMVEKYQKYIMEFAGNFLCLLVFWGGMLRKSFNADTIFHMVVEDADIFSRIEDGRYVVALGDCILFRLGFRVTDNLSIATLVAFILFAFTMMTVQHTFKEWMSEENLYKIGYCLGVNLVFLNVLFAELLMFGEFCVYFGLGYLMAAIAVQCFTRKRYVGAVAALIIAVCTYQYTVIFAAILLAFYLCLHYKGELSRKAVLHEIAGIGLCLLMGGLNLLSVKSLEWLGIIGEFRKSEGIGDVGKKLRAAMASFIDLNKSSANILPEFWIPMLFTAALLTLITINCVREHKCKKIPFILMVWGGGNLLLYVIPLMQENFSFASRMSFCFYLVQGLLAVTAYAFCNKQMKGLVTAGCICYIVIQLLFSNFVVTNHFVSNTLDEVYANMFYREILKYEDETGCIVTRIAYRRDAYCPHYYDEVAYTSNEINERALGQVTNSLIEVITGRKFENTDMTEEEFHRYFKDYVDKDWNYLDLSEQLVIVGDTAYWCVF